MAKERDLVSVYYSASKRKYVAVSSFGSFDTGDTEREAIMNLREKKEVLAECGALPAPKGE